jgi:hypothetical protein
MDHAVRVQREISKPTLLRKSRARLVWATVVCVPLIALSAYSWIARPTFIWGPSERSVSAARQDADIRFAMYLLAQRVESYRGTEGPYPATLDALGEQLEGVSYRVISDSVFELRAERDGKPLVFRSNENVDAFLGNSPSVIQDFRR